MPRRQLALMAQAPRPGESVPLGSPREFIAAVAMFNTAPDGGPSKALGMEQLHGPGFILEFPAGGAAVAQCMIHINDEDCAWPVLTKMCRDRKWKLVDLESGRSFGG